MDINDERDYAEEAYNRALAHDPDEIEQGYPSEYWSHPQLPPNPGETEDEYIERFSEFSFVNQGREIRGLE